MVQCMRQDAQLVELLHGEGEPGTDLGVERRLVVQVDWHVQQRARWRDPQALAQLALDRFEPFEGCVQVGLPDIAAVDHAQRQHLILPQRGDGGCDLVTGIDGVQVQAIDGQGAGKRQIVFQAAEVGRQQQLDAAALQRVIGGCIGVTPARIEVEHQRRFVDLHPLDALRGEPRQQLRIHGQQMREQVEAVAVVLGLAQPQIGQGTDDDRFGLHAQRLRLRQLFVQARGVEGKGGIGGEFRDDVVVVGVEPFGHFAGVDATAIVIALAAATGHAKVGVERRGVVTMAGRALRDIAQREAHVEHLVVQRELADRGEVEFGLLVPVALAQLRRLHAQFVGRALRAPEALERKLQFAACADAGKAEVVGDGHDEWGRVEKWMSSS